MYLQINVFDGAVRMWLVSESALVGLVWKLSIFHYLCMNKHARSRALYATFIACSSVCFCILILLLVCLGSILRERNRTQEHMCDKDLIIRIIQDSYHSKKVGDSTFCIIYIKHWTPILLIGRSYIEIQHDIKYSKYQIHI